MSKKKYVETDVAYLMRTQKISHGKALEWISNMTLVKLNDCHECNQPRNVKTKKYLSSNLREMFISYSCGCSEYAGIVQMRGGWMPLSEYKGDL